MYFCMFTNYCFQLKCFEIFKMIVNRILNFWVFFVYDNAKGMNSYGGIQREKYLKSLALGEKVIAYVALKFNDQNILTGINFKNNYISSHKELHKVIELHVIWQLKLSLEDIY